MTSGGRSVGIVSWQTQATEFSFSFYNTSGNALPFHYREDPVNGVNVKAVSRCTYHFAFKGYFYFQRTQFIAMYSA
jgi:hypothetical protein